MGQGAPAGVHLFQPGDTLLAAQVQNNLQDQVIPVFSTPTARDSAMGASVGDGQFCYTASSSTSLPRTLWRWSGAQSAWRMKEAWGTGSPENVVAASPGAQFTRTDGGTGTTLYVKETGASVSGWTPVGAATAAPLWVDAGTLTPVAGTPVMGSPDTNVVTAAMLFDAAASEAATTDVYIPAGWATVNVDFWWVNPGGGGAGNVVWSLLTKSRVDGTNVYTGATTTTPAAITAAAANVMKVSRIVSALAVTADSLLLLYANRIGSDGGDTLANDVGLYGILVTKAS